MAGDSVGLTPIFYVVSLHGSGTPIHIPDFWPHGYYNTRYGLAALPLLAFGGGALAVSAPVGMRRFVALVLIIVAIVPWAFGVEWICWKESEVNSKARRTWTHEAAEYLRAKYKRRDGIFTMFGDMTGILREAGIPMREALHDGNNPAWLGAKTRPDLFLNEEWAVATADDEVDRAVRTRPNYRCVKMIQVAEKGAPVILIYHRQ